MLPSRYLSWWSNTAKEALKIKFELNDSNLGDFKSFNGWLEPFKQTRIFGEGGDVPITTIKA